MTDMICRKTMKRCQTPGMCSPFGGCNVSLLAETNVSYKANTKAINKDELSATEVAYRNLRDQYADAVAERDELLGRLREARGIIVELCQSYDNPLPDATIARIDAALARQGDSQ